MQVTIDIPDEMVGRLQRLADESHQTLEQTVAGHIEQVLLNEGKRQRPEIRYDNPRGLPRIESSQPGTLKFGPEGVYEYIPFP